MSTDLSEIRAALAAATPGPWEAEGRGVGQCGEPWGDVVSTRVDCMAYCYGGTGSAIESPADAHLIANAPAWLAELVARVEAAEASQR